MATKGMGFGGMDGANESMTQLRAENQRLREKFVRIKEVWARGWAAWELRKKAINSMRARHDQAIQDCMKAESDLQAARLTIASLEGRLRGKEDALEYAGKELERLRFEVQRLTDRDQVTSAQLENYERERATLVAEVQRETIERCIEVARLADWNRPGSAGDVYYQLLSLLPAEPSANTRESVHVSGHHPDGRLAAEYPSAVTHSDPND